MAGVLRIATFNLENLDDRPEHAPTLQERIAIMRPQLERLKADIVCLQEVNGQEQNGQPRRLLALGQLLAGTSYANYHQASTTIQGGVDVYDERNLVILSRFQIIEHHQYKHDYALAPLYRKVTSIPAEDQAKKVTWERPLLYARINLGLARPLHVINLHLKSKRPSNVEGQKLDAYTWRSASGWAEGFFLSAMRRVGQALEARILIDQLFDTDEQALIVACGDMNAESDEVPVEALRGDVENTSNAALATRVMVPCERTIAGPARFSLLHQGTPRMIDHLLVSRGLLAFYAGSEIHNEILHDESVAFATDIKYPESDHAPVIAEFHIPDL
jgi:endonuclease/exonuclease/phosphatase family metal-dependent hydrolase